MNNRIILTVCLLCLFVTAGCAGSIMSPAPTVPSDANCDEFATPQGEGCAAAVAATNKTNVSENEFVNYTQVAADYREHGERTPRDQRVTQAGAGNNISASIPPSIEDEVIDYEEQININDGSKDGIGSYSDDSAEDPVEDWLAEEGQSLKFLLTEWSERAGWRLIWNTNRNYTLNAGAVFRGRFADVSSALIRAFARARPAPIATFYKGNRVLVVETMEDENAYE